MKKIFFLLLLSTQILFSQSLIKENISWNIVGESVFYKYENTMFRVIFTDYTAEKWEVFKKEYVSKNTSEIKTDVHLKFPHFYTYRSYPFAKDLYDHIFYYYVVMKGKIVEIVFSSVDRVPKTTMDTAFFDFLMAGKLDTLPIEHKGEINFWGRVIPKNKNWKWVQIDRLADETTGEQMNWSVHSSLEKAKDANAMQLQKATLRFQNPPQGNQVKLVSDKEKEMLFEAIPTKVRKLVYSITSENNIPREYITYVITQKVRGKNMACVMSFYPWGNYSEDRLPPMLSSFLKAK